MGRKVKYLPVGVRHKTLELEGGDVRIEYKIPSKRCMMRLLGRLPQNIREQIIQAADEDSDAAAMLDMDKAVANSEFTYVTLSECLKAWDIEDADGKAIPCDAEHIEAIQDKALINAAFDVIMEAHEQQGNS